jgi:hypothetical protein
VRGVMLFAIGASIRAAAAVRSLPVFLVGSTMLAQPRLRIGGSTQARRNA